MTSTYVKHPFNGIFRFVNEVVENQIFYNGNQDCSISIILGKTIHTPPKHNVISFNPFYEIIEEHIFNQKYQIFKKWCLNLESSSINTQTYTNHVYTYKDIIYNVKNIQYTNGKEPPTSDNIERECYRIKNNYTRDFEFKEFGNSNVKLFDARISTRYIIEESLNKLPHHKDFSNFNIEYITEFTILNVKVQFCTQPRKIRITFDYNPKTSADIEKDIIDTILKVLWFNDPEAKVKTPLIPMDQNKISR